MQVSSDHREAEEREVVHRQLFIAGGDGAALLEPAHAALGGVAAGRAWRQPCASGAGPCEGDDAADAAAAQVTPNAGVAVAPSGGPATAGRCAPGSRATQPYGPWQTAFHFNRWHRDRVARALLCRVDEAGLIDWSLFLVDGPSGRAAACAAGARSASPHLASRATTRWAAAAAGSARNSTSPRAAAACRSTRRSPRAKPTSRREGPAGPRRRHPAF